MHHRLITSKVPTKQTYTNKHVRACIQQAHVHANEWVHWYQTENTGEKDNIKLELARKFANNQNLHKLCLSLAQQAIMNVRVQLKLIKYITAMLKI